MNQDINKRFMTEKISIQFTDCASCFFMEIIFRDLAEGDFKIRLLSKQTKNKENDFGIWRNNF